MEKLTKTPKYWELGRIHEEAKRSYFTTSGALKIRGKSKVRKELPEIMRVPDFDYMASDSIDAENIVDKYAEEIEKIRTRRAIDYLGFVERKCGRIGALSGSCAISIVTEIPNILIRPYKDIMFERVKLSPQKNRTRGRQLFNSNVALITDHCTTGREMLQCADIVKKNGGIPTDVVTYASMSDKIELRKFEDACIEFHPIYSLPEDFELLQKENSYLNYVKNYSLKNRHPKAMNS